MEDCLHEDDISYGESIDVTKTKRVVQILCETCGRVGTQVEQQDKEDEDHWSVLDEMWHKPQHYYSNVYINAMNFKIGRYST